MKPTPTSVDKILFNYFKDIESYEAYIRAKVALDVHYAALYKARFLEMIPQYRDNTNSKEYYPETDDHVSVGYNQAIDAMRQAVEGMQ